MEAVFWLLVGVVIGGASGVFATAFVYNARARRDERAENRRIVDAVWEAYPQLPIGPYVEPVDAEIISPRSTLADLSRDTGPLTPIELDDLLPELGPDDEPTGRIDVTGTLHPEGVGALYESGPVPWQHAAYVSGRGVVPTPCFDRPSGLLLDASPGAPLVVVSQAETGDVGQAPPVQPDRYEVAS